MAIRIHGLTHFPNIWFQPENTILIGMSMGGAILRPVLPLLTLGLPVLWLTMSCLIWGVLQIVTRQPRRPRTVQKTLTSYGRSTMHAGRSGLKQPNRPSSFLDLITLRDVSEKIVADVLIFVGERDHFVPACSSRRFYQDLYRCKIS
ncbi:hypothetical protein S101447_02292 [Acetobacter ascendens]|uniref:Uncharacterized protein n=1 Tax=Acetobacter ascendens TaxID=481146 RepID=A0A1Y0V6M4_9PROT|nr:hypothetical protein S101447_02292 [Acetobacter ascendens]